jgi:epoxide hydrolase
MTEAISRRGVLLATAGFGAVGLATACSEQKGSASKTTEIVLPPVTDAVSEFNLSIPVGALDGLKTRLAMTRWPNKETNRTPRRRLPWAGLTAYGDSGSGYARIQGTRPQTLGYSLADSPVGQAAWIYEKLSQWSDPKDAPALTNDEMLDNIMLYWLTNTAASSARLYFESFATDFSRQQLDMPVAVSVFPGEMFQPPKVWGERTYSKLVYWNVAAQGGHFAAFEQPDLFVAELRKSLAQVR